MVRIVKDEDIIKEIIEVTGITDIGTILRSIRKDEMGDTEQVPVEFRRYIQQATIRELPKGIIVYRGVRNGMYVDFRQLQQAGMSRQEADNIVGDAKTPEEAHDQDNINGREDKPEERPVGHEEDGMRKPAKTPEVQNNDDNDNKKPESVNVGQELLKSGIAVGYITGKDDKGIHAQTLMGETVNIVGINGQNVKIILLIEHENKENKPNAASDAA